MEVFERTHRLGRPAYVLPVVLVLIGALFVLAVAVLSLSGNERTTARQFVDHRQAELAVISGLEKASAMILDGTSTDAFVVLNAQGVPSDDSSMRPPCYAFLADWDEKGDFQYAPLFSASEKPPETVRLELPDVDELMRTDDGSMSDHQMLPWMVPVKLAWLPIENSQGQQVARYAFWVEDLQGRVDPRIAGNDRNDGNHSRVKFPSPAVGAGGETVADQLAAFALDPEATALNQGSLGRELLNGRHLMVSPLSAYAAVSELSESRARVLDKSVVVGNESYEELALVPPIEGIEDQVVGMTKVNLNHMLEMGGDEAVGQMAGWIRSGLPRFELRKGGFPDDYLKTLAAHALDYADEDSVSTRDERSYAGIDAHPVLSEVVLHLHFQKLQKRDERWVLVWRMRLFAELWNMNNQPIVGGVARTSYEVDLTPTPIGAGGEMMPFDDPRLLMDPTQSAHQLEQGGGVFYGPEVVVSLAADEYRFYEFATVDYTIDCTPWLGADGEPMDEVFDLAEPEDQIRGITLLWNGQEVHRVPRILRDPYGLSGFKTNKTRKTAKACIPGHSYGGYGGAVNNMGDPRIAPYLRAIPLGENAYPDNVSPHRRNVRRRNIYDRDQTPKKTRHYGRVLPSEWPDGGHDSAVGDFRVTTSHAALPTDQSKWPMSEVPTPQMENAPQRLSNRGRYFSATELGRLFDPVMWMPAYPDLDDRPGSGEVDTEVLLRLKSSFYRPAMPTRRGRWPEVSNASRPSAYYGGGNTLRIGRPEHQRFDQVGWRASRLLDLFHVGVATSADAPTREGDLIQIRGHLNINTASEDALRCLAAGWLGQDPGLCRVVDPAHDTSHALAARTTPIKLGTPSEDKLADQIAQAIIANRPYLSPSQLAEIHDEDGRPVFGNPMMYEGGERLQWSDAAAEELFARVHDGATVRSRNFRVWVIGQALDGSAENPEVVAESRRVFTVFSDPDERGPDGEIQSENHKVRIRYAMDF